MFVARLGKLWWGAVKIAGDLAYWHDAWFYVCLTLRRGMWRVCSGTVSGSSFGDDCLGGGGVVVGILVMIGLPIVYGGMGFATGAIGALIYNALSGLVGGVEMEVETSS